jgi:hypothetical protein
LPDSGKPGVPIAQLVSGNMAHTTHQPPGRFSGPPHGPPVCGQRCGGGAPCIFSLDSRIRCKTALAVSQLNAVWKPGLIVGLIRAGVEGSDRLAPNRRATNSSDLWR